MEFRCFDLNGNQITLEDLRQIQFTTPAMEHVIATVRERVLQESSTPKDIEYS